MRKFLSNLMAYLSIAALLFSTGGLRPVLAQAGAAASGAPIPAPTAASPVPPGYLTGPNAGTPRDIALNYLRANQSTYGLTDTDLTDLYVSREYTDAHNGLTHLYFVQRWQGVEIFNAVFNFNIDRQGRVLYVGNRFVSNLAQSINATAPTLTAQQAVESAAQHLGLKLSQALQVKESLNVASRDMLFSNGGISQNDIPAKLMYDASGKGTRLTWNVIINELSGQHWWNVRVDASTGEVVSKNDWVVSESWDAASHGVATTSAGNSPAAAPASIAPSMPITPVADGSSYQVYNWPVESPIHVAPLPPADGRITVTQPADELGSPFGWHDTNGAAGAESTLTIGNNVQAYLDLADDDTPTIPTDFPADGGAGLDFVFAIDLTQAPSAYRPAVVTNLFYWNNLMHDIPYRFGFDEASGNFQENNYGRGGVGSDSVNAEAQDGGGTNNANFATPADGSNPRMQMYLWTAPTPDRDGDFDNGIITHEYGHGISNRLTGNSVSCLNNSEQMGEGWSDWQSIYMTMGAGEDFVTGRGIGTYALNQATTGVGIRPAKYSTDMGVNNFTYANLSAMAIPHGVGFVWNTMLYEMTAALVTQHGLNPDLYGAWNTGGNNLAYQLVTDGMKIQPCNPGFVDGRDAILAADQALTGGANKCTIWGAFAKRGLGFGASQGASTSTSDGTTSFVLPPACQFGDVTPSVNICQGQDAIYPVAVGAAFTAPVTMTVFGNPAPSTTAFSANPVLVVPSTTTLTVSNTGAVAAGTYTLTIGAADAVTSTNFNSLLNVFAGAPGAPTLTSPSDGSTSVALQPNLQWSGAGGTNYMVQVATDAGFGSIVYSTTVSGNAHVVATPLTGNTTYYWRVTASNACGSSSASSVFSFTTVVMYCSAPNLAIADNATASTNINIANPGLLLDVNISISGTHTWVGDTVFTVTHASLSATIVDRPGRTTTGFGCSGDNFVPTLDDEGPNGPVENQCANLPALFGSPTPNNPLSVFDGEDLSGLWTLSVSDGAGGDTGVLQQWCIVPTAQSGDYAALTFEKTVGTNPASCAAASSISVGYGTNVTYCYKVTNSGNVTLTTHSLVDDHLGPIFTNFPYDLAPSASVIATASVPLTATTVNSATWTATGLTYTVSASDTATVTVIVTPTVNTGSTEIPVTQAPNAQQTIPFNIANTGMGSTLTWAFTETAGFNAASNANVVAAPGSTAADRAHSSALASASAAPETRLTPALLPPVPTLSEGFDNITTLPASGWYTRNNSSPLGTTGWFQGNATVFPAQAGATTAYVGANFNSTTGDNTISNWLLTPELTLANGATFSFYTRKATTDTFPDRLQVRLSTSGASTNVGTLNTDVGDFTTLMLDINPTLITGVYPTVWTQYTVTVSGLGAPTTGRLAFRYFVTNGGPAGANSDYIGIDTVEYVAPLAGCNAPGDVSWLSVSPSSGTLLGGENTDVGVTFDSTGLTLGNTYTATLCLTTNDPNMALVQVPVTLSVSAPTYGASLAAQSSAQSSAPGTVVTYTLTVTNTGNTSDSYTVTVGGATWSTTPSASTIGPVNPGGSTTFNVVVTIPAFTSLAAYFDDVQITVTSQADPNETATVDLTTTATVYRQYLTLIRK